MAELLTTVRIILGAVFVLLAPGYAWSLLFFPTRRSLDAPVDDPGIDLLERIAIAFGLSIALVPTMVFLLAFFFDVPVTFATTGICVGVLIIIPLGWTARQRRRPTDDAPAVPPS